MNAKLIALYGATGAQGAPVATRLAAAGHTVRAVTRAAGADLLDRASLVAAYAGADAVVAQLPLVYDERALAMGDNVARAAEQAGVRHLVLNASSPLPPEPIGVPFLDARLRVAAAAVPLVTVLAPTAKYLDNLTAPWSAERVARDGVIAYPMPAQAPDLWVAMDDVAAAIATAIERAVPGRFALPGAALTGDLVAEAVADGLGRPVRWEAMAPRDWAELVRPHLGDHAADGSAPVYEMGLPPAPAPDPGPARDALGWAAPDVAAWARSARWPVPVG